MKSSGFVICTVSGFTNPQLRNYKLFTRAAAGKHNLLIFHSGKAGLSCNGLISGRSVNRRHPGYYFKETSLCINY
jgi:hypothetical protein